MEDECSMLNAQCSTDKPSTSAIRKQFYALRNGLIADTLRKGGLEQKYIFGLQLPQIKETATLFRPEDDKEAAALARDLWGDKECREARLLACHLMPPAEFSKDEAVMWAKDITTREEADILAFRLIRYLPDAAEIAVALDASASELHKYAAIAINRFL